MFASAAYALRLRMDANALLRVFKGARLRLQDLPCLFRLNTALSFLRTKDAVDFKWLQKIISNLKSFDSSCRLAPTRHI